MNLKMRLHLWLDLMRPNKAVRELCKLLHVFIKKYCVNCCMFLLKNTVLDM
eukprot:SAG22_NODE_468_length_10147_cov_77.238654_6_plen_51_part_00